MFRSEMKNEVILFFLCRILCSTSWIIHRMLDQDGAIAMMAKPLMGLKKTKAGLES